MSALRVKTKKVIKRKAKNAQKMSLILNPKYKEKLRILHKTTRLNNTNIIEIAVRRFYEKDDDFFLRADNNSKD